jgi:hypothetical protein
MTLYGINRYLSVFVYKTLLSCYDTKTIAAQKASYFNKDRLFMRVFTISYIIRVMLFAKDI